MLLLNSCVLHRKKITVFQFERQTFMPFKTLFKRKQPLCFPVPRDFIQLSGPIAAPDLKAALLWMYCFPKCFCTAPLAVWEGKLSCSKIRKARFQKSLYQVSQSTRHHLTQGQGRVSHTGIVRVWQMKVTSREGSQILHRQLMSQKCLPELFCHPSAHRMAIKRKQVFCSDPVALNRTLNRTEQNSSGHSLFYSYLGSRDHLAISA